MRRLAVLLLVLCSVAFGTAPVAAQGPPPPTYRAPVDGTVIDPFRLGADPYGPGNRGVDYLTAAGEAVRAAADGVVTHAGRVGSGLHVVVLHADGLRTSYSFLSAIAVRRGQKVGAGAVLGSSGGRFHWGARAGTAYLDPLRLLAGPPEVHLAPQGEPRPASEATERRGLVDYLTAIAGTPGRVAAWTVRWARTGAVLLGRAGVWTGAQARAGLEFALDRAELLGMPRVLRTLTTAFQSAYRRCTPVDGPPPRVRGRRILVQVAGLGSTGYRDPARANGASVLEIEPAGLGYAAADTYQFSYNGGSTRDTEYGPADTTQDIRQSAVHLRVLLRRLRRAHPGVPIDVVAHSQGGLVGRLALRGNPDVVDHFVTLATPHNGATIATALGYMRGSPVGDVVEVVGDQVMPWPVDGTSIGQLSETSTLIADVKRAGVPPGVKVTSIAAANDVVVPAPRCIVPGATNVVVSTDSLNGHADLPGSAAGRRELALALTDSPPACTSLVRSLANAFLGEGISVIEHRASMAALAGRRP